MAEHLGRLVLAGVEEVGFGEILQAIRQRTSKTAWNFGVSAIDELLDASSTTVDAPVLELESPVPTSGATSMLYHLLAVAVLSVRGGGLQSCAVLIDADGNFDIVRLVQQLVLVLRQLGQAEDIDVKAEVDTALRHVHVFRPQSLASMTATAASLSKYLLDGRFHSSFDRRVGFVAIDTPTAFGPQTQAEDESDGSRRGEGAAAPYVALGQAIRESQRVLSCPVVLVWRHETRHRRPFQREQTAVLSAWSASDCHRVQLRLERLTVRKFPARSSVQEAKRDAEDRQKVVDAATCRGWITLGHYELQDSHQRLEQPLTREFEYCVDEHGLTMIHDPRADHE